MTASFDSLRARVRADPVRAARVQAHRATLERWLHKVAHVTRHNYGHPETFWHEGTLMVGFRCNCGQMTDVIPCRGDFSDG